MMCASRIDRLWELFEFTAAAAAVYDHTLNDLDVVFQILNDLEDYAVTPISGPQSGSKSSAVPPPPVSAGLWPAPLAVHQEDSGSGQSCPVPRRVRTGGGHCT